MRILTRRTFLFGLLFIACCGDAQVPKAPVTFQSPTAANLGLFGDIPVSYFTGLPKIEVPLYTFNDNKTTLPITLNYHASGFRPDMHPGWTGGGWNLSANYAITRNINDAPDDYSNSNYYIGDSLGFYFYRKVLDTSIWNQVSYMEFIARSDSMYKDTEPDEFSFNYPGGSGKFYLDWTGIWKVKCDKPVKIVFDNTYLDVPIDVPITSPSYTNRYYYGNTKSFSGFTIIDENGVQYVYGKDTSAIEYGMGMFSQWVGEWIAQAWYLTKIIQPGGYQVTLNYERDDFINQMYLSVNNIIETRVSTDGWFFSLAVGCGATSFNNINASYGGQLIAPVYLKSIEGSDVNVEFVRSQSVELNYNIGIYDYLLSQFRDTHSDDPFLPELDQDSNSELEGLSALKFKKLDSIKVKRVDGTIERKFALDYTNDTSKRLTLQSVTEIDKNGMTKPPYLFYYDSSVTLPPYLANKNDHWGFYNGTAATIDEADYYLYYYAKRNPDSTYLYAGTLNKIIYPTGGVTEFQYEPHHYRKRLQELRYLGIDTSYDQNTLAGGLRIKKVTSYNLASDSIKFIKQYSYDSAGVSSGVLGGQIRYYFDDYRCLAYDASAIYANSLFSSQSVLPGCNNAQGSHVGYSYVREKLSDSSYTDYYYTNFDKGNIDEKADTLLQMTRTAYEPYASTEAERGNLLMEKSYSASGILLQKREFTYTKLNKSNEYVRALKCRHLNICPNTSDHIEEGTAYKIYTYSFVPSTETETVYDMVGSNPLVVTKTYNYDSTYRLLKTMLTYNSKGDALLTSLTYPFDYPSITVYQGMMSKNIVADVIEKTELNNSDTVQLVRTNYSSPYTGLYKPETIEAKNGNAALETRFRYYSYDTSGNLISAGKENDLPVTYLWNYNKNYPIAECIDSDEYSVAYTSFEADGTGYWGYNGTPVEDATSPTGKKCYYLSGSTILSNLNDLAHSGTYIVSYWSKNGAYTVSGFSYSKHGPTVNGWTYYEHEITDRTNAEFSGTGYIDEVRLYKKGGRMTTYTYDPLYGITSKCDVNNHITYYEYDNFGRLSLIRDQDKNVLRKFCYNYAGQVEDCGTVPIPEPPPNVALQSNTTGAFKFYTAVYTDVSTSQQYSFNIPFGSGPQTLGEVPAGTYDILISRPGGGLPSLLIFGVGCSGGYTISGTSAQFYDIEVTASDCNTITMELDY